MYKKGVFLKKRGGLSLWGFSTRKKREAGGSVKREKRGGGGGVKFPREGGSPPASHFLME